MDSHGYRQTRRRQRSTCWKICFGVFGLVACVTFVIVMVHFNSKCQAAPEQETPDWQRSHVSEQQQLTFTHNAVASDATVCNIIGAYVLNTLNGSAMDAAVSTVLCIGVANAHSAGIGGGSSLMHFNGRTKQVTAINYREAAPGKASTNMFNDLPENATSIGGLAIAVPGEVRGLALAHSRFGRLPWETVVSPVVQLLRNGHRVTQALADAMQVKWQKIPDHSPFLELKSWMRNPATGETFRAGEVMKDEKLAATMERVAKDPSSFYSGSLANDIVQELQEAGSIITAADLSSFRPVQSVPVTVNMTRSRLRLHSTPPPSSGAVVGFVLNVLDGFAMDETCKKELDCFITFHHRLIEALKFGFARRSALGDPEFVNVSGLIANLTSHDYANEIRSLISDSATHPVEYYGPCFESPSGGGTSHVSLVDSEGSAVTVTSTINNYFGSFIRGSRTGIIYNNQMDDFSVPSRVNHFLLRPSPSNFIEPGKRPMSSVAPIFVTDSDNNLKLLSGAAGGSFIISALAGSLARLIFLNESVKEATDAFRLHHQLLPDEIEYHESFSPVPQTILDGLKGKGHRLQRTRTKSIIEAIVTQPEHGNRMHAVGDFRKPSIPSGF